MASPRHEPTGISGRSGITIAAQSINDWSSGTGRYKYVSGGILRKESPGRAFENLARICIKG